MKIGIVSHYVRGSDYKPGSEAERERIEKSTQTVEEITEHLDERGVDYVLNRSAAQVVEEGGGIRVEEMGSGFDVVVTVGGDGTILRTIRNLPEPIPILGINTGRVGFLADIPLSDAISSVDGLLDGFETTERARLSVVVNGTEYPAALNETVIVTSRPAKIMEFDVTHDGNLVESVRSDGIVVATPTGSTAYAMSAGGPLVDPTVGGLVVVPLAPFRKGVSPWVLNSDKRTRITPTRVHREAAVVVDGVRVTEVGSDDVLEFTRADRDAVFVETGKSFFEKVREKLS